MSTQIVMDEDVKVWVAARTVAQQKPEFSAADVGLQAQKMFKADAKKIERFVTDHCVANTSGTAEKHYNYLFKLGTGKYRMFKQGDPIEFSHATAPTTPPVSRVPSEHKGLFSTSSARFPEAVKPITVPTKAIEEPEKPRRAAPAAAHKPPEPATKGLKADLAGLDEHMPANIARKTIFDQLFLEFGKLGSQLDMNEKQSFTIQLDNHAGVARTKENLLVKMPKGTAIAHKSDIVLEVENPSRTLYVDIVEAAYNAEDLKAHSFDAMHLRKEGKNRYGVIVYIRTPNGTLQEQAEALAYSYDFFFGVDSTHVKDGNKFYALKSQILQWLHGKVKPAGA